MAGFMNQRKNKMWWGNKVVRRQLVFFIQFYFIFYGGSFAVCKVSVGIMCAFNFFSLFMCLEYLDSYLMICLY